MAVDKVSPGAALLRTSRMFSLPPPMPHPLSSCFYHETTTQSFPIRQTITTPQKCREHGDWGFKRPLPLKTTLRSSQPYLRINQIDSVEAITDFSSATDHTISLKKWHELAIPITMPPNRGFLATPTPTSTSGTISAMSALEDMYDTTVIADAVPGTPDPTENFRWKFKGPYLSAMSDRAFRAYLIHKVKPRRAAFQEFLRQEMIVEAQAEKAENEDQDKMNRGELGQGNQVTLPSPATDDVAFMDYMRNLRERRVKLYGLVSRFLDLAPISHHVLPETKNSALASLSSTELTTMSHPNPYARYGPPRTHPSGGMYYSLSSKYLDNHPIYGPQKFHAPVRGRMLNPGNEQTMVAPMAGIAGFVVNLPGFKDNAQSRRNLVPEQSSDKSYSHAMRYIDGDSTTAPRLWASIAGAKIHPDGKLEMSIGAPDPEAKLVQKERMGELQGADVNKANRLDIEFTTRQRKTIGSTSQGASNPTTGNAPSYGLSSGDFARGSYRPSAFNKVQPLGM